MDAAAPPQALTVDACGVIVVNSKVPSASVGSVLSRSPPVRKSMYQPFWVAQFTALLLLVITT